MKPRFISILAVFSLLSFPAVLVSQAADLTGTWLGNMTLADGGNDALTLVLTKAEEGYGGTIRDEMGLMPDGTDLQGVAVEDTTLTFYVTTSDTIPFNFNLTIGRDTLTGRWDDPTNGTNGTVELRRGK